MRASRPECRRSLIRMQRGGILLTYQVGVGSPCGVVTASVAAPAAFCVVEALARPTTSSTNFSLATAEGERTNGYASASPRPRFRLFNT